MSVLALGQYFGRVSRRWSADSLTLSPVIHEQARVNVAHAHEAAFVTLMLDGEYTEKAAQRSFRFDRFSAIYHPPALEHQDFIGASGVQLLMFEFRPQLLEGMEINRADLRAMRDLSATRVAWRLLSLYRDMQTSDEPLDFESRALELIGEIVHRSTALPRDLPSLLRAREYLHAHYSQRIMIRDIALAAGIHPVYLGQMFHRDMGETIASYISRLRVRAAAEQLTRSDRPLVEIALDHGFCDQSHFHRVFRKLSGVTPATFRSQFRDTAAPILRC